MNPPTPQELRTLLSQKPAVYDFPYGADDAQERQATFSRLSQEALDAAWYIFRTLILAEETSEGPGELSIGALLSADHSNLPEELQELVCSDDWRLLVFSGESGTLYDFNGWPGDNQAGGAVFYRSGESTPFEVFSNGDTRLTPTLARFDDVVRWYEKRRIADFCDKCDQWTPPFKLCAACGEWCCPYCKALYERMCSDCGPGG